MRRHVREITSPSRLDWTVRRLIVPAGMRPMGPIDMIDAATPRRTVVDGMAGTVPDPMSGVTGPLPLGFLLAVLLLPLLPVVLALRYLRVVRWVVEGRAYPWGRRFPPVVLAYAVRGHREAL